MTLSKAEVAQAVIDSPLTTKGVVLLGGSSAANVWLQVLPEFLSIAGGITAMVAGVFLVRRHYAQEKLADEMAATEREQRAANKIFEDLRNEKIRIEIENLKGGLDAK